MTFPLTIRMLIARLQVKRNQRMKAGEGEIDLPYLFPEEMTEKNLPMVSFQPNP